MGVAQMSSIHQSDLSEEPGWSFSTSARRSQTRINKSSPPYMNTIARTRRVKLGVPTAPADGSPKSHVLARSNLKGELVKEPPIRMRTMATKPSKAGCQRKDQPSKGPGVKRPSGV